MSTMKVLVLTGLIIMGLVIDLGGVGPSYDRIGFRYWKSQPFSHYLFPDRDLGVFLGVWSVMVSALFAYMGTELSERQIL
jgi:amino acid transporter